MSLYVYFVNSQQVTVDQSLLHFKGTYIANAYYSFRDVVNYLGFQFIALRTTNQLLTHTSTDWSAISVFGGGGVTPSDATALAYKALQTAWVGTNAAAAAQSTATSAQSTATSASAAAAAGINLANQALVTAWVGTSATSSTALAYTALQTAWSGTSGANSAISIAVQGTNEAAAAINLGNQALTVAFYGTQLSYEALQTSWTGTNLAYTALTTAWSGTLGVARVDFAGITPQHSLRKGFIRIDTRANTLATTPATITSAPATEMVLGQYQGLWTREATGGTTFFQFTTIAAFYLKYTIGVRANLTRLTVGGAAGVFSGTSATMEIRIWDGASWSLLGTIPGLGLGVTSDFAIDLSSSLSNYIDANGNAHVLLIPSQDVVGPIASSINYAYLDLAPSGSPAGEAGPPIDTTALNTALQTAWNGTAGVAQAIQIAGTGTLAANAAIALANQALTTAFTGTAGAYTALTTAWSGTQASYEALQAAWAGTSHTVGGDLAGNLPNPRVINVSGTFSFNGTLTATLGIANNNNYNPGTLASSSVLRLTSGFGSILTGLSGGYEGRIIIIENVGSQVFPITAEDANSLAQNRFSMPTTLYLFANHCATFRYDNGLTRWLLTTPMFIQTSGNGDLGGTSDVPTVLKASSSFKFTSSLTPPQLPAGTTIDYGPTGFTTNAVLRVIPDGAGSTLSGLQGATTGRILFVENAGTAALTLSPEDATSIAGNRFALREALVLAPNECVLIQFDIALNRWIPATPQYVQTTDPRMALGYTALQTAWSGTSGADAAFALAVVGTNEAAAGIALANQALTTAFTGTANAYSALQMAWSGTSGADAALALAGTGTLEAQAAIQLANQALTTAFTGTATADTALQTAWNGTAGVAQDLSIVSVGTAFLMQRIFMLMGA